MAQGKKQGWLIWTGKASRALFSFRGMSVVVLWSS